MKIFHQLHTPPSFRAKFVSFETISRLFLFLPHFIDLIRVFCWLFFCWCHVLCVYRWFFVSVIENIIFTIDPQLYLICLMCFSHQLTLLYLALWKSKWCYLNQGLILFVQIFYTARDGLRVLVLKIFLC